MAKIGVIGAGAWGTALAQVQAKSGREVILWAREPEVHQAITEKGENTTYLPGIQLEPSIKVTQSISEMSDEADILLLVTPAQYIRSTLDSLRSATSEGKPLVICSKGIELDTGLLLSQVVKEELPEASCAVMTGPSFAREIAQGLPSAVTLATSDRDTAQYLSENLASKTLRPYLSEDVLGAQIGGAIKNVVAIACGALYGKKMGENARAALMTRGIAEMGRLASAMGAKKETLMGMCGLGDVVLTCSSLQSRNFSLGVMLGEGRSLKEIMLERKSVTEGVHTAKALMTLANKNAVDMPICEAVNNCLNEGVSIEDAIEEMLNRPFAHENSH